MSTDALEDTPWRDREWSGIRSLCSEADFAVLPSLSLRATSVRRTFRRAWPLRNRLGITRIADLTELDHLGVPVAAASRPAVKDAQITVTQGKGLRGIDALTSALMESVERYSAAHFSPTARATVAQLLTARRAHLSPERLGADPTGDRVLEWVDGVDVERGQRVLVPAAEVLFPYDPPPGVDRPMCPTTTGLAAGNTVAEALLHAMLELIERDSVSRFLAAGGRGRLLDVDSVRGAERALLDRFYAAHADLVICDLSETAVVPVFFATCLGQDGVGPPVLAAGQGAHLSPRHALRRALLEAAQSRLVALQGSREDLARHAGCWDDDQGAVRRRQAALRAAVGEGGTSILGAEPVPPHSVFAALGSLTRSLRAAGYGSLVYTDLTSAKVGLPVVHAIIPGMADTVADPRRRRIVPNLS